MKSAKIFSIYEPRTYSSKNAQTVLVAPHSVLRVGREGPGLIDRQTICGAGCLAGGGADEVDGVFGTWRKRCLADDEGDVGVQVQLILIVAVAGHQANVQRGALPFRRHRERGHFQNGARFGSDADRVAGLCADVCQRHVEFLVERIRRLGVVRHRHTDLLVVREHADIVTSVLLLLDVARIDVGRAAVVTRRDADIRQALGHHRVAVVHGAQQGLHGRHLNTLEGDDFGGVDARISGRDHPITRLRAGEARIASDFVVRVGAALVDLDIGSMVLGRDVDVGVLAHRAEAFDGAKGVEFVEGGSLHATGRVRCRRSGLQFSCLHGADRGCSCRWSCRGRSVWSGSDQAARGRGRAATTAATSHQNNDSDTNR